MKKLVTLFIALVVLGIFPIFASANTNPATEAASFINAVSYGSYYNISGYSTHMFTHDVNRGHVDILISGDGSTDLDLYVYIGGRWLKSDSYSDDEKICLGDITRSGYIKIKVVNRGGNDNSYQLIIK